MNALHHTWLQHDLFVPSHFWGRHTQPYMLAHSSACKHGAQKGAVYLNNHWNISSEVKKKRYTICWKHSWYWKTSAINKMNQKTRAKTTTTKTTRVQEKRQASTQPSKQKHFTFLRKYSLILVYRVNRMLVFKITSTHNKCEHFYL